MPATIADTTQRLRGAGAMPHGFQTVDRSARGVRGPEPHRRPAAAVLLGDSAELLAIVWSVPLAVMLVGTPIALTLAFLLWIVRSARGAF